VDGARFHDKAPPEAQGVRFLGDESEAIGDGAPFLDENEPCLQSRVGAVLVGSMTGAASRIEVGNPVEDQRAEKAQVTAGTGEDAVLSVGIPPSDAVLEFGRAVEMDFLSALDRPVFEDVVAARRGVALAGRLVGAAALEGVRDDSGEGAERVHRGQPDGFTKFSGHSGGQRKVSATVLTRKGKVGIF